MFSPFWATSSALRGLVPRCEDHCSACEGSSGTCIRCKEGFSLLGGSCVTNETCTNGKSPWPNPRLQKLRVSGDSLCRVKPKAAGFPGHGCGGHAGRAAGCLPVAQPYPRVCTLLCFSLGANSPTLCKAPLFLHQTPVKDALKKRLLYNSLSANTGTNCTACSVRCLFI